MEEKVIKLYTLDNWSLRRIADELGTNHHRVKRILKCNGIPIEKKPKKPITDTHRENLSKACKGRESPSKGRKMSKESVYKNMASHLRFDVSSDWLRQFEDLEKLKFLNGCVSKRTDRFSVTTKWYQSFILKFYSDYQFEKIYRKWVNTGDKYLRPTIDHINPRSKGGGNDLDNLQFLTWFENRAKDNMSQIAWNKLKENINEYLV